MSGTHHKAQHYSPATAGTSTPAVRKHSPHHYNKTMTTNTTHTASSTRSLIRRSALDLSEGGPYWYQRVLNIRTLPPPPLTIREERKVFWKLYWFYIDTIRKYTDERLRRIISRIIMGSRMLRYIQGWVERYLGSISPLGWRDCGGSVLFKSEGR